MPTYTEKGDVQSQPKVNPKLKLNIYHIDCISPHLVCMWMGTPNLRHQLTLWSQKEMVCALCNPLCNIRLRRVWQYLQAWPEIYYIFIPDALSDNFLYKVLHLNSLVCKNLLISFYPSIKLNRNKVSGFWYISKPAASLFGKWKDYYAGLCLLGFMSGTKKKVKTRILRAFYEFKSGILGLRRLWNFLCKFCWLMPHCSHRSVGSLLSTVFSSSAS